MSTLCLIASLCRRKKNKRDKSGVVGAIMAEDPSQPCCFSLQSLQGSEQLGDYNHRGNAAGQADKRGLRAGLGGWRGLSVCQSIWLSVKITQRRGQRGPWTTGLQSSRWSSMTVRLSDCNILWFPCRNVQMGVYLALLIIKGQSLVTDSNSFCSFLGGVKKEERLWEDIVSILCQVILLDLITTSNSREF